MKEFNNLKDSTLPVRGGLTLNASETLANPEGVANPGGGVASNGLFCAHEPSAPPDTSLQRSEALSTIAEGDIKDLKDFKDLKPLKEVKEVKEVRSASQEHVLSRYAKCQPATDIQIKNFIKTLASLFNQTSVFWQIITRELLDMRPTYDHLKDLYHYLTRVYPYPTITAQTILGFNTQIKTFNAEEMSNLMHRFPDKRFAKISLPEEGKYVYTTLEEAEKTNIDYDVIESLRERYDLPC